MKKLGFGLMRLPVTDRSNQAAVDVEQVKKMVDLFLEKGFTYFDTAWMYNGFESERVAKTALVDRYPRDAFTLADKLHAGFSFHDTPEMLDEILTKHPEMEFVQLQINYLDWESPWVHSRACYEVAVKHGKPVIVMEPCKGGTLAKVPEAAEKLFRDANPNMSVPSWAIRFAAGLPNVMVVLSGMSDVAQMEDNLRSMEHFTPLTAEETALCHKAADIINSQIAIPCTGCAYCTAGCPQHIAIPQYFSLYNEDMRERLEEKGWTVNYSNYDNLHAKFGRASDCIACGQCEGVCPQHLPIIENLKKVARHYGK